MLCLYLLNGAEGYRNNGKYSVVQVVVVVVVRYECRCCLEVQKVDSSIEAPLCWLQHEVYTVMLVCGGWVHREMFSFVLWPSTLPPTGGRSGSGGSDWGRHRRPRYATTNTATIAITAWRVLTLSQFPVANSRTANAEGWHRSFYTAVSTRTAYNVWIGKPDTNTLISTCSLLINRRFCSFNIHKTSLVLKFRLIWCYIS